MDVGDWKNSVVGDLRTMEVEKDSTELTRSTDRARLVVLMAAFVVAASGRCCECNSWFKNVVER